MDNRLLHDLILMNSSAAVLDEVHLILGEISQEFDIALVTRAFHTTVDLFDGKYPGFQACNTACHDLHRTTQYAQQF
ncbi:hypothetical protein ACFL7E_04450 [Thermodesulfobacteriota bacterium]